MGFRLRERRAFPALAALLLWVAAACAPAEAPPALLPRKPAPLVRENRLQRGCDAAALKRAAATLSKQGKLDRARRKLEAARQRCPGQLPEFAAELVRAEIALGRLDRARKLAALLPTRVSLAALVAAAPRPGTNSAAGARHFAAGERAFENGQFCTAESELTAAARVDASRANALALAGRAARRCGHEAAAQALLDRARARFELESGERGQLAWPVYGWSRSSEGRYESSDRSLRGIETEVLGEQGWVLMRRVAGEQTAVGFFAGAEAIKFLSHDVIAIVREAWELRDVAGLSLVQELPSPLVASPSGERLAFLDGANLGVYELATGTLNLVPLPERRDADYKNQLQFIDAQRVVVTRSGVDVVDVVQGRVLGGMSGDFTLVSPGGRYVAQLVPIDPDWIARVYQLGESREVARVLLKTSMPLRPVLAFAPDERRCVVLTSDGEAAVISLPSGAVRRTRRKLPEETEVRGLSLDAAGRVCSYSGYMKYGSCAAELELDAAGVRFVSAREAKQSFCYDTPEGLVVRRLPVRGDGLSGAQRYLLPSGYAGAVSLCNQAISPDLKTLAFFESDVPPKEFESYRNVRVLLVDAASGLVRASVPIDDMHSSYLSAMLDFSPNGKRLAAHASDELYLIDVQAGKLINRTKSGAHHIDWSGQVLQRDALDSIGIVGDRFVEPWRGHARVMGLEPPIAFVEVAGQMYRFDLRDGTSQMQPPKTKFAGIPSAPAVDAGAAYQVAGNGVKVSGADDGLLRARVMITGPKSALAHYPNGRIELLGDQDPNELVCRFGETLTYSEVCLERDLVSGALAGALTGAPGGLRQ